MLSGLFIVLMSFQLSYMQGNTAHAVTLYQTDYRHLEFPLCGEFEQIEKDDYMRVFVFNNNAEAKSFDKLIKQPHEGRYYKLSALYEILKDEYKRF